MHTTDLIDCWTNKGRTLTDEESLDQTQSAAKDTRTRKYANDGTSDTTGGTNFEHSMLDVPITQDHLNHARVCNALVTVCADGLRDILHSQIPQGYQNFY